jgi:hypothetical protein
MYKETFIHRTDAWILLILVFVFMIISIYAGRKIGSRGLRRNQGNKSGTTGIIVSAMFGLLAFLLAFTFGMSGNRYEMRRTNIVDEANAIGTAIVRADLYQEDDRTAFRKDFRRYVEARIDYYEKGDDLDAILKAKAEGDDYGKRLWNRAVQLSRNGDYMVASLQMVPALNEMMDISTTRVISERAWVPDSIVYMLFIISLSTAFYLGYSSARKGPLDWFVAIGFCLLTSVVIYITLDLDRPRRGLINLDTTHNAMVELRKLF